MRLDKETILDKVLRAEDFTSDDRKSFRGFITGPIGIKMLAHLLTLEESYKDQIATCDFTSENGVATATRAQGGHQAIKRAFDLILELGEQTDDDGTEHTDQ